MPKPTHFDIPAYWVVSDGPAATLVITSPTVSSLMELWPDLPKPGLIASGVACYYGGLEGTDYKSLCIYGTYARSPVIHEPLVRGFHFPVGVTEPLPMDGCNLQGVPMHLFASCGPEESPWYSDHVRGVVHWRVHPFTPKILVPIREEGRTVLVAQS